MSDDVGFWKDQAEQYESSWHSAIRAVTALGNKLVEMKIENEALRVQVAKLIKERVSDGTP